MDCAPFLRLCAPKRLHNSSRPINRWCEWTLRFEGFLSLQCVIWSLILHFWVSLLSFWKCFEEYDVRTLRISINFYSWKNMNIVKKKTEWMWIHCLTVSFDRISHEGGNLLSPEIWFRAGKWNLRKVSPCIPVFEPDLMTSHRPVSSRSQQSYFEI